MSEPVLKKSKTGETQYNQLAKVTTIVADTGDVEQIKQFKPTDATTVRERSFFYYFFTRDIFIHITLILKQNPSLIYKAAKIPGFVHLVENAIEAGKDFAKQDKSVDRKAQLEYTLDRLCVNFGVEISKIVPGYVSTEVDARLSYDVDGSVRRARRIIDMYKAAGVGKDRVLIKLATTWEGIQAAKILKKDGIHSNMTLLFSFAQAVAAAEAGVRLISPFVGRILDWYKKSTGKTSYPAEEDPGVLSVRRIYNYYKKYGYKTIVMGASFRSKDQITALMGCDRLTIGPKYLKELSGSTENIDVKLSEATAASKCKDEKLSLDEKTFRWMMCEDAMATEKLAEGIRKFAVDIEKLEKEIILPKLA